VLACLRLVGDRYCEETVPIGRSEDSLLTTTTLSPAPLPLFLSLLFSLSLSLSLSLSRSLSLSLSLARSFSLFFSQRLAGPQREDWQELPHRPACGDRARRCHRRRRTPAALHHYGRLSRQGQRLDQCRHHWLALHRRRLGASGVCLWMRVSMV
jgi:hypothetical protein